VDGVEIVRVGSRTRAAAARRAAQAGGVPCTLDDLPGGADAVLVATPPRAHASEAARAVDAGAVVLVETPLAATLAEADEIVTLAGRGRVAYAENLVHSPVVAEAVHACRTMGSTTHLEVRVAQGRPEAGSPRLDPSWGGGVLFDLGVHAIAVALLMAAPDRVTSVVEARLSSGDDGGEVDEDAVVVLGFDSGLRAEVRASWRSAASTWDAQAASPTGAVRLELVPEPSVELNGAPVQLAPAPGGLPTDQLHHLGYTGQLASLATSLSSGQAPRPGAEFGRLVLDIVCAAYTSAGQGRAEAVPFTGDRSLTPHEMWRA
jgi:predicted dehydrogenase